MCAHTLEGTCKYRFYAFAFFLLSPGNINALHIRMATKLERMSWKFHQRGLTARIMSSLCSTRLKQQTEEHILQDRAEYCEL